MREDSSHRQPHAKTKDLCGSDVTAIASKASYNDGLYSSLKVLNTMGSLSNLTTTEGPHWNTPEHHGPAVSVVTWVCIVGVVLAVASRIITRYAVIRTLQWDDITCLLATVRENLPSSSPCFSSARSLTINLDIQACAIAQSIAVSVASDAGLGSPAASLTSVERTRFLKVRNQSTLSYQQKAQGN